MAYSADLARRVRAELIGRVPADERKMFGGVAFMLHGNMAVGINEDRLMVRVDPEEHDNYLAMPHVRQMDFTGRSMRGWIYVASEGVAADEDLAIWVSRGVAYASTLPPK